MTRRHLITLLDHYLNEAISCDDDVSAGRVMQNLLEDLNGPTLNTRLERATRDLGARDFTDETPTATAPAETMAHLMGLLETV